MRNRQSTSEKQPLLDTRGRLLASFWSTENERSYSGESASRFRSRDWELCSLLGQDFVFRLLYGTLGSVGLCRAAFTDLRTGEYCISGPMKLFPGDGYALDFTAGEPHHLFCDREGFFLSWDFDGEYNRLRCYSDQFDVELMLPNRSEILYTASPFENLHRYFYAGRQVFSECRGAISFHDKTYSLEDAFVLTESGRGVFPLSCSRVLCCASQVKEGHSLSLLFGWGFGHAQGGLENALFLDGEVFKLNRIREDREGDFLAPSRFYTEDGAIDLTFTPWRYELFSRDYRLLYFRSHCSVGKISGQIDLSGYGKINIDSMPVLCEHSRFRF